MTCQSVTKKYLYTILGVLVGIHSKNILYGDLKPYNIMFYNKTLHFIDFGCSLFCTKDEIINNFVGTPLYCAPEVWDKKLTWNADAWAFGILMYHMVSQKYPFWNNEDHHSISLPKLKYDIKNRHMIKLNYVSETANDLIVKLLEKDVSKRLSCEEAIHHPWFTEHTY